MNKEEKTQTFERWEEFSKNARGSYIEVYVHVPIDINSSICKVKLVEEVLYPYGVDRPRRGMDKKRVYLKDEAIEDANHRLVGWKVPLRTPKFAPIFKKLKEMGVVTCEFERSKWGGYRDKDIENLLGREFYGARAKRKVISIDEVIGYFDKNRYPNITWYIPIMSNDEVNECIRNYRKEGSTNESQ